MGDVMPRIRKLIATLFALISFVIVLIVLIVIDIPSLTRGDQQEDLQVLKQDLATL